MDLVRTQPEAVTDAARLAALASYDILDTPPEEGFDDIVELATLVCDVPIALVSFVANDRQWFKASVGFPSCQTDLDQSVCAYALVEPDLLVIPDLTADPRTRDNPLVRDDPHIRFYAGAPLRTRAGQVLGSLCVIDKVPRAEGLTPRQAQLLRNLARQIMTLVELRRSVTGREQLIVDRRKAEDDQTVLNQELSHRMKNMLAMVQAIATQTLKGVTEQSAVDGFRQRLHALSFAHDILLQKNWSAAPLEEVVLAVLGRSSQMDRIGVAGPDVTLGPRATLSISLLLHEMATNAAKYGALSVEGGRVAIDWRVDVASAELVFTWRETGGPPASEPTDKGFGSRLLRAGLIGTGGATLRYLSTGFEAEMRASMEQVRTL